MPSAAMAASVVVTAESRIFGIPVGTSEPSRGVAGSELAAASAKAPPRRQGLRGDSCANHCSATAGRGEAGSALRATVDATAAEASASRNACRNAATSCSSRAIFSDKANSIGCLQVVWPHAALAASACASMIAAVRLRNDM